MPLSPLSLAELRRCCDPASLGFETTESLPPLDEPVGQRRAVEAMRFAVGMRSHGYNLFCVGSQGVGKLSLVQQLLADTARDRDTPGDWVYVHNFDHPNRPHALCLPAGSAEGFSRAMAEAARDIGSALPAAVNSDDVQARRQSLDREHRSKVETVVQDLTAKAAVQSVGLVRGENGLGFAPMADGKPMGPDAYHALSEAERAAFEDKVQALHAELQARLKDLPKWQRAHQDALRALIAEVTRTVVAGHLAPIREAHAGQTAVIAHLDRLIEESVTTFAALLAQGPGFGSGRRGEDGQERDRDDGPDALPAQLAFRRFHVNVLTTHRPRHGAPVVLEDHPTQPNLVGRIEHQARYGTLSTDFTLIRPGALHRANGGFLIIEARKLLMTPFVWEDLKRALSAGEIRVEAPGQAYGLMPTITLEPAPIPLDVKVILLGDRQTYYMLAEHDPDFLELFKITADFDNHLSRDGDTILSLSRLLGTLARREGLRPLSADGVARLVDHAARLAEDSGKLTAHMASLTDLAREADHFANEQGSTAIDAAHVSAAIAGQERRDGRMRDVMLEEIVEGTIRIETEGGEVGQVNGLAVYQFGRSIFARPSRISCRVRVGRGEVLDIEREVELGGPLHSKGVLILSSFLATRFGDEGPLSLSASLVFEQSYGEVDGDSASSAELYAILSALAEVPINQGLAVTGSVDQFGHVQAIGGVNEKIEGFFEVCQARGLTGNQGVLIPATNVRHLMLREEVVTACAAGRFAVYGVATVDEAMSLLTGLPAGEPNLDGLYPDGSLNRRIARRLETFARRAREHLDDSGTRRRHSGKS